MGVNSANLTFSSVSLESERYVCIQDRTSTPPSVELIDILDPTRRQSYPISADSARINPTKDIIGLKLGRSIQLFDYKQKIKIKDHILTEEIIYWKWLSSGLIALITNEKVYHWDVDDPKSVPTALFDRHDCLRGSQIITYRTDSSYQWCALVGIRSVEKEKIVGNIQLFSVARNVSQPLEGFACSFSDVIITNNIYPSKVFSLVGRSDTGLRLTNIELLPIPNGNKPLQKSSVDVPTPPDSSGDFPFSMHQDKTTGIVFIVTKNGIVFLYDLESAGCIFANRISDKIVFVSADLLSNDGFIAVNRGGSVFSVRINKDSLIPFLTSRNMIPIANAVGMRSGYPGSENLFISRFNELFNSRKFLEAALLASKSQSPAIRNQQTIARFHTASSTVNPGEPSPILLYFKTLLEHGKLNAAESLEFCKPLIAQKKLEVLVNLIKSDKFECTEDLGDLVRSLDLESSLSIYLHARAHEKVIQCFAEMNNWTAIPQYAARVRYNPDYLKIIKFLCRTNPTAAKNFAKVLLAQESVSLNISEYASCFVDSGLINECISFLIDALKKNDPSQSDLQTKLIELAITNNTEVARSILAENVLTHYDRQIIAKLCEQNGLVQYAIANYTDFYDIKRALTNAYSVEPDWLITFFGTLSVDDSLEGLRSMLETNRRQNQPFVVAISCKYHELIGDIMLVRLFESLKAYEALYEFLFNIINISTDPDIHFRYIQICHITNHTTELERICKESNYYDPEKAKNFLKESKLSDQLPLIIVCDRYNFIQDLVLHFFKTDQLKNIEIYAQRINPTRLPLIVGALLDVNCSEEFILNIMRSCPRKYSLNELVKEVSERNRIKLIKPIVEARIQEGSQDSQDHSALALIYIDSNYRPDAFLKENSYYDNKIVGKYCEKRDPNLACIAYEKGLLDDDYIRVCIEHGMFKNLARYTIHRSDPILWAKVLDPNNNYRQSVIEQASQSILMDAYDAKYISIMVKSFMTAKLSHELIDLLEKILFSDSPHKDARNLQNLLILTAINSDSTRVIDYINRLNNFDAPDIAKVAIKSKLYEEAFSIFQKFAIHSSAVEVLAIMIGNFDRAYEYAERCNDTSAWSILGRAQLANNQPREAIDSFIKAQDPSSFLQVIEASKDYNVHEAMVRYLTMVRLTINDSVVDSELVFSLAQTHRYDQLNEFLENSHSVNVISIGDRLFEESNFEGAKIFFIYANNFPKLAATYVKLKDYTRAVEMARKANNTKMWKLVCVACLQANEYKFAQDCAINIVIHPEELDDLVSSYEKLGLYNELIALIEQSTNSERAHMGIFTELAILYAKYKPSRMREHIELYNARIIIPKVLKHAEEYHMWPEVVYLYDKYQDFDHAISTMIAHPAASFNDNQFRDIIQKAANHELYHRAISFYVEFKPIVLSDLMIVISARIDHNKAISQLKILNVLPLCKTYLRYVQKLNLPIINETLNSIYIEEEDYAELSASIDNFSNFDAIKLSDFLADHPSIEMRRISTKIRKISNRWFQTVEMAKQDNLLNDAIVYACESRDSKIAQSLLEYFVELKRPELILALLYSCYDLLRPDNVLESCWISGYSDYAMPFMIQYLKDASSKIESLESKMSKEPSQENSPTQGRYVDQFNQLMISGNTLHNPSSSTMSLNNLSTSAALTTPRPSHNPFK